MNLAANIDEQIPEGNKTKAFIERSFKERTNMRYIITLIISIVVAWMTSPYYLSITPNVNSVVAKFAVALIMWIILSLLVKKK